jgi:hypothetical protein
MFRLFLATFIAAFALQADTFTSTSCTVGTTTFPCAGIYPGSAGPENAMAGAGASDNSVFGGSLPSPLPPFSGQEMWAGANAAASTLPTTPVSAQAHASAFNTFGSAGSARVGLIEFDVLTNHSHAGDATVTLTDGTHTYGYQATFCDGSTPPIIQNFTTCGWHSIVPLDLGAEFQVTVSADITVSFPASSTPTGSGGGDDASVLFRLLEAHGTTVVPFSVIPEPSACLLVLLGLGACARLAQRSQIR